MSKKIFRSLIKIIIPYIFKILIKLKLNRRVIIFLSEKSYNSNNIFNFKNLINNLLKGKKITALDVGAQGGFNSDNFFSSKYNIFFKKILVEPIKSENEKIKEELIINKGLWSKKQKKILFLLDNRLGSSSMYEPDKEFFDLHDIKKKNYQNFEITRTVEVECDTLSNELDKLQIKKLDYLKIDTQGAELEILKGLGPFRPLFIRVEAHFFSMYKNVPSWHELVNFLYDLNYVLIDLKGIGNHSTRIPAEADLIFIPNFNNSKGKELIMNNIEIFFSLMLIFGQLKILQVINKKFQINLKELEELEDNYFN